MSFLVLTQEIRDRIRKIAEVRGVAEREAAEVWISEEAAGFLARRLAGPPPAGAGGAGGERRRAPRAAVRLPVAYRVLWSPDAPRAAEAEAATVENVSRSGLFVVSDRPHPPGTLVHVDLPWPGLDEPVEALAVVAWTRPIDAGPGDRRHGLGLAFCHVEERTADRIAGRVLARLLDAAVA